MQGDQAARHWTVRPIERIFLGIFKLVGDSHLKEEE
jgi:hypothetical protein